MTERCPTCGGPTREQRSEHAAKGARALHASFNDPTPVVPGSDVTVGGIKSHKWKMKLAKAARENAIARGEEELRDVGM